MKRAGGKKYTLILKKKKDKNTLINQIDHFADVVNKKVKPKVSGDDGLNSLKILEAIKKAQSRV